MPIEQSESTPKDYRITVSSEGLPEGVAKRVILNSTNPRGGGALIFDIGKHGEFGIFIDREFNQPYIYFLDVTALQEAVTKLTSQDSE